MRIGNGLRLISLINDWELKLRLHGLSSFCHLPTENQNNHLSDHWRRRQLEVSICPPDHPYNRFGTGFNPLSFLRVFQSTSKLLLLPSHLTYE